MSNPIADTANFFQRRSLHHSGKRSHRHSEGGLPGPATTEDAFQHDGRSTSLDHQAPSNNNHDDSRPWNRVLSRLSHFGHHDTNVAPADSTDDLNENDTTLGASHYSNGADGPRNTFELMRENRWFPIHFGGRSSNDTTDHGNCNHDTDDDLLPSTCDFKHGTEDEQDQERANYFVHPFQPATTDEETTIPTIVTSPPPPAEETTSDHVPISFSAPVRFSLPTDDEDTGLGESSSSSSNDTTSSPQPGDEELDPAAKAHWGKTLEKIKLISSMQQQDTPTTQLDTSATTIVATSRTLVPYYPPAFDPLFIAFTRDEHGHKSVSGS
jgi:hypothetical protein